MTLIKKLCKRKKFAQATMYNGNYLSTLVRLNENLKPRSSMSFSPDPHSLVEGRKHVTGLPKFSGYWVHK